MWRNSVIKQIGAMVLFVLFQVLIFNNINFWGYINPYVYILFILFLPVHTNRFVLLLYAFIMGLTIDFFESTGGINAMVTVFIAFIRTPLLRLLDNGSHIDFDEVRLSDFSFFQWVIYLVVLLFLQHFLIDYLESFQWDMVLKVLERSAWGTLITLILSVVFLVAFPIKSKTEL